MVKNKWKSVKLKLIFFSSIDFIYFKKCIFIIIIVIIILLRLNILLVLKVHSISDFSN